MPVEQLARDLALAVWRANGAYCKVEVRYLCTDNLPWEDSSFGKDEYEEAKDELDEVRDVGFQDIVPPKEKK